MGYLGNDLKVAYSTYKNIDDISGSFNGSTTSFSLLVGGVAPSPLPLNSQQCLISVGGVVQRPDDTGAEGFRLSGGNIVFSSAPSTGEDFFGVILAGADYVNVGANFPSGSAAVPSITFDSDLDTGIYNSAANQVSITTAGTERLRIDSAGQIESVSLGSASAPAFSFTTDPNTGVYSPGADQVAISTNGTGRLFVNSSGSVGVGASSPSAKLHVIGGTTSGSVDTAAIFTGGVLNTIGSGARIYLSGTPGFETTRGTYIEGVFDTATNAHSLRFATNSSSADPVERLRITAAGLVGIGTTSPSRLLHLSAADSTSFSSADFDQTYNFLRIVNTTNDKAAGIYFGIGTNGEAAITAAETADGETALVFGTRGGGARSERARLDHAGRLLVGTSTSINTNALLQVYKASGNNVAYLESASLSNNQYVSFSLASGGRYADLGIFKHAGITNPGPYLFLGEEDGASAYYWTDNSGNFRVSNNGDHIGTTSGTVVGTQTSDERLKNIIGPVEYGLDTINQLEPVRFALKSEPDTEKLGFIAQQVKPLVPQSVFDTKEHIEGEPEDAPTKLGMEYVSLIPVLVNAIKELSAEVDALKAQLS